MLCKYNGGIDKSHREHEVRPTNPKYPPRYPQNRFPAPFQNRLQSGTRYYHTIDSQITHIESITVLFNTQCYPNVTQEHNVLYSPQIDENHRNALMRHLILS